MAHHSSHRLPSRRADSDPALRKTEDVDEKGKVVTLEKAGVTLTIPPGAVRRKTTVSIQVSSCADNGNLMTTTSVSPRIIFHPDQLRFQTPVTLVVPHCAISNDRSLRADNIQDDEENAVEAGSPNNSLVEAKCRVRQHTCEYSLQCLSELVTFMEDVDQKTMGFVPFKKETCDSTVIYVEVYFCNDLPSEYLILERYQKRRGYRPWTAQKTFYFNCSNSYRLQMAVNFSARDSQRTNKYTKNLDARELFDGKQFCVSFSLQLSGQERNEMNKVKFALFRDDKKRPISKLEIELREPDTQGQNMDYDGRSNAVILSEGPLNSEEDTESDSDYDSDNNTESDNESDTDGELDQIEETGPSFVDIEEATNFTFNLIEKLLNLSISHARGRPIFADSLILKLKQIAEELEKERKRTNMGVAGGSLAGSVGGVLTLAAIATAPPTGGMSAALLVPGIILSVFGTGCNVGSVISKYRFDKKSKAKVEKQLTDFVDFHKKLITSIYLLFKSRQEVLAIKKAINSKGKRAKCMDQTEFKRICDKCETLDETQCTNIFEVVEYVFKQSEKVVAILGAVKNAQRNLHGGIKFSEQGKRDPIKNLFVILPLIERYHSYRSSYVSFCKELLKIDTFADRDKFLSCAIGADVVTGLLKAGAGIGLRASGGADDIVCSLGYVAKICKGLTVATYVLCVLGIVVDLGCFAMAIRDLCKDDKQPFTMAVLECVELLEDVNETCIAL